MTEFADLRFRDLVSRYLESTLDANGEAELLEILNDSECWGVFSELCQIDRDLSGLAAQAMPDEIMIARVMREIEKSRISATEQIASAILAATFDRRPARPVRRKRTWVVAGLTAAAVLAAIWLGWAFMAHDSSVAVVKEATGDVRLQTHSGTSALTVGQRLNIDQGVVTGEGNSRIVVQYPDGTRVEIGPETSVSSFAELEQDYPSQPRKRLRVLSGSLMVDAAKQPPNRPMIISTPQAEVLVIGTKFTLETVEEGTQVRVAEGAVRMRRHVDQQAIEVPQGTFAVATPDIDRFVARPIVAGAANRVKTLVVANGTSLAHKGGVAALAFTKDGNRLVSGSLDETKVRVWDLSASPSAGSIDVSGHNKAVWSADFSPDGERLVTGGVDGMVRLINAHDGSTLAALYNGNHIRAATFSPDGKWLATGAHDSVLRMRDPVTGQEKAAFKENDDHRNWVGVYSLAFSPDAKLIATGLSDGRVRIRSVDTGKQEHLFFGNTEAVYSVAFSPDGQLLASASHHEVLIWEVATGRLLKSIDQSAPVAFSPDSQLLAVGGMNPGIVDVQTGRTVALIEGYRGKVFSVAFQPGKPRLAIGDWRGIVLIDLPSFESEY